MRSVTLMLAIVAAGFACGAEPAGEPSTLAGDAVTLALEEVWDPSPEDLSEADREAGTVGCGGPEDCATGLCYTPPGGEPRCAETCDAGCPAGTSCRAWLAAAPDIVYLCLPDAVPFCRPCDDDAACRRYPGDTGSFCEEAGPGAGSFCTTWCDVPEDCPDDHECGEEGLCRPPPTCDCLAVPGNVGYATSCVRANDHGACAGVRSCTADGLTPCEGPVPEAELCDGADNDCDGTVDDLPPGDACLLDNEHGTCPGSWVCQSGTLVCEGQMPAAEACDGADNDCDGKVDEKDAVGCFPVHPDLDGDGFGSTAGHCACQLPPGHVPNDLDCSDGDAGIHPGAAELCDGVDNDCDGAVDEGCDQDGDGFCGVPPLVWGVGFVCESPESDCDDLDPLVHPGAQELCDGKDNNCLGQPDEGCDEDGDGYCGSPALAWGPAQVCQHAALDCNDQDPGIHPGAEDGCNARDDDCDGTMDEGCDVDGDGFCPGEPPQVLAGCAGLQGIAATLCAAAFQEAVCPGGFHDCDDSNPAVHPGAVEGCDGVDEDCDGQVDDGLDLDGDGFCPGTIPGAGCAACPLGGGDCDDGDGAVHPAAVDLPDLEVRDTNCDGIDGDVKACVFVDVSTGKDFNDGTPGKPKETIQAGLDEALADGSRNCVLVALGSYVESGLEVPSGIHLWGGYAPGSFAAVPGLRSTLQGGIVGVRLVGDGGSASLGRMVVTAVSATQPGQSSVGVLVSGLQGALLADLEVYAGTGAPGTEGAGGSKGIDGGKGKDGSKGCTPNPLCGGSSGCQLYAAGSVGSGPLTCGGYGQGKAVLAPTGWSPAVLAALGWSGSTHGEPSCCYQQSGVAAGGAPGKKGCEPAGDGTDGQDGVSGLGGQGGAGGSGSPVMGPGGLVAAKGGPGGWGGDGCGGGGGGKGDNWDSWWDCEELGGGGGGGGSGGTGGQGGLGGQGGGSSVALLVRAATATVKASKLVAQAGGQGGKGGPGGVGGYGGQGGSGGSGLSHSGDGGDGGNGGMGGGGGGGGGGRGGHSVALATTCGYPVAALDSAFVAGPGGTGGFGGMPGPPGGKTGSKGAPGAAVQSACFKLQ